jgi:hypothetical protein
VTTPSGLLVWGQNGQYNAVDDRSVITALANTRNGIVKAAALSAGSGLMVNIAGGWLAVANCGDGTAGVVGSRTTLQVAVPAGPASGTLTSYLWADVTPDAATFTINVITPAQAAGRSGVQIGTVVAGAGQNLASQMTITAKAPSFGQVDGLTIATAETGGSSVLYSTATGMLYVVAQPPNYAAGTLVASVQDGLHRTAQSASDQVTITPKYTIPLVDFVPFGHYRIWTSGIGKCPSAQTAFWFDFNLWGGEYVRITFAATTFPAGTSFNFQLEGHVQLDNGGKNIYMALKADLTSNVGTTFSGQANLQNVAVPTAASYLHCRTNLGQLSGGGCDTWSSVFQRFGGADPTAQITP